MRKYEGLDTSEEIC